MRMRTALSLRWVSNVVTKSSSGAVNLRALSGAQKGISVLSLNVPATRNALSGEVISELSNAVEEVNDGGGRKTRVLLIASEVQNVFCAGADLKERKSLGPNEQLKQAHRLRSVFEKLARCEVPTMAVLEGAALGGGAELAVACDIRVASRSTLIGFPECRLAIIPGAGGTQRLPRLVGISTAKELLFTGRRLSAEQAKAIGLIDHVVENDMAMSKALSIAKEMLECGPLALGLAKKAIDRGMDVSLTDGLNIEGELYTETINTKDRAEGILAFNEKRKPKYKGQ